MRIDTGILSTNRRWIPLAPLFVLLGSLVLFGSACEQAAVGPDTPVFTEANPPPFLSVSPADPAVAPAPEPVLSAQGEDTIGSWECLAHAEVKAGEEKTVGGGRYELLFREGSLKGTAEISIEEWDSHLLVTRFGPHGIQFGEPVTLTVDYAGTNADPSTENFDGTVPVFWWFNPSNGVWDMISGKNDTKDLTFTVDLKHFSTYGLGGDGTAGWD